MLCYVMLCYVTLIWPCYKTTQCIIRASMSLVAFDGDGHVIGLMSDSSGCGECDLTHGDLQTSQGLLWMRKVHVSIIKIWHYSALMYFLAATKQLYEWYFLSVCPSVCLSVCPSVRLSVRLSHLFDYVPIIVSSWNFQELSPRTRVRSMQKVKVRGQRSRSQRSQPNFSFPDCNSSLNAHMMMKWYI